MNAQKPGSVSLQRSLKSKLAKIGVDVEGALEQGNVVALAAAIQAVSRAQRALSRPIHENAPTDERARKSQSFERVTSAAHQIVHPIVELKRQHYINDEEFAAADRFRVAHETMHRSQGVANWLGTGGGGGQRLEMTERQQMAGQELARAYEALGKGSPHAAAINFILEMPAPGHTSVLSWVDFAKTQIAYIDGLPARHFSYGWLHTACQKLAHLYAAMDAERQIERRYSRAASNNN